MKPTSTRLLHFLFNPSKFEEVVARWARTDRKSVAKIRNELNYFQKFIEENLITDIGWLNAIEGSLDNIRMHDDKMDKIASLTRTIQTAKDEAFQFWKTQISLKEADDTDLNRFFAGAALDGRIGNQVFDFLWEASTSEDPVANGRARRALSTAWHAVALAKREFGFDNPAATEIPHIAMDLLVHDLIRFSNIIEKVEDGEILRTLKDDERLRLKRYEAILVFATFSRLGLDWNPQFNLENFRFRESVNKDGLTDIADFEGLFRDLDDSPYAVMQPFLTRIQLNAEQKKRLATESISELMNRYATYWYYYMEYKQREGSPVEKQIAAQFFTSYNTLQLRYPK